VSLVFLSGTSSFSGRALLKVIADGVVVVWADVFISTYINLLLCMYVCMFVNHIIVRCSNSDMACFDLSWDLSCYK
jgi:hypothetical protein